MLKALVARLPALAVLICAVVFTGAAESRPLGGALLAVAALAFVMGPLLRLEPSNQVGVAFIGLVAGVLMPRVFAVANPGPAFLSDRALLATCPAILIAAARCSMFAPRGGDRVTLAVALVGLAGCGRSATPLYLPGVVAFALLSVVALGASEPGRVGSMSGSFGRVAGTVVALAVAGGVALGIAVSLPRLHQALISRITSRLHDRTGFSSTMSLGDLDGMLQSKEVVARVRGDHPQYLRGAVFSLYVTGLWEDSTLRTEHVTRPTETHPAPGQAEMEYPRLPERYFVPKGADDLRVSTGEVSDYGRGIVGPTCQSFSKRVGYAPHPDAVDREKPTRDDLQVPHKLVHPLRDKLAAWVPAHTQARDALDIIQHQLQTSYQYSLQFERTSDVDPVLDFLENHPSGHCEYFASSFALLARARGVPARVVTGFRVSERSPLSDYAIVRERDAHAWVEVYLDGEWVTYDPTPPGALDAAMPHDSSLSVVVDLVSTSWEKVDDFLGARTPFQLSLALVSLVGLLVLVRRLRSPERAALDPTPFAAPMPCLVELEKSLATRGLARAPHETLGALSDRVRARADQEADLDGVAPLLDRYGALRYGRIGDEAVIADDMLRAARRLRSSGSVRPG